MAIREIIKVPNPILKKVSKPVDVVDDEIRKVLDDMLDTMYDAPGIGLAAIQIGIPLRMLVIDISSVGDQDNNEKDPSACPSVCGFGVCVTTVVRVWQGSGST